MMHFFFWTGFLGESHCHLHMLLNDYLDVIIVYSCHYQHSLYANVIVNAYGIDPWLDISTGTHPMRYWLVMSGLPINDVSKQNGRWVVSTCGLCLGASADASTASGYSKAE